jgi:AcrR family transcriptional regulator
VSLNRPEHQRLAQEAVAPLDSSSVRKRDTRAQLILAAERLFAERGIDGVSLREINLAAKQRNTSAAHYHFGSKEALIDAIFEFRRGEIGRRRDALLDVMEASGHADPRALAEALIVPIANDPQQGPAEGGRYYLQFVAQVLVTTPNQAGQLMRKHTQGATARWAAVATKSLPDLPRGILLSRSLLMARNAVISLAAYSKVGWGLDDYLGFDAYLNDMIDAVAGYLSAPVSARTLELMRLREDSLAESRPKGDSVPSRKGE